MKRKILASGLIIGALVLSLIGAADARIKLVTKPARDKVDQLRSEYEGLAQLEEGATTAGLGTQLARTFASLPAYAVLEASFLDLPNDQVGLAYAKSLAGLEYLRDTFGQAEIRRLLKALAANPDFNSLLGELRLTYPAFEREVAGYVEKRYGS